MNPDSSLGTWILFPDRPVGLDGDILWQDDLIRDHIARIARRIVAPLLYSDLPEYSKGISDSITFAIYGKWGMGKSSALRMIRENISELVNEVASARVLFCNFVAPAYETFSHDLRTMLMFRILSALGNTPEQAVNWALAHGLAAGGGEDIVMAGQPTEDARPTRMARTLQQTASLVAQVIDFEKTVASELTGKDGQEPTKVMVVFIDDLDRCKTDYVWQVLASVQQWCDVPNIFFVLAVDQDELRKTVEERFERVGGAANPDYALEKYVQHSVWIPSMDGPRLKRYVAELMRRYGSNDLVSEAIVANWEFLEAGLRVRTPRSVKRCLNAIRPPLEARLDAAGDAKEQKLDVKERILEYVWPSFYQDYFVRASSEKEGGNYRRAMGALETACRDFIGGDSREEDQLRFSLKRISVTFALQWDSLELNLVRFLGLEPYWFAESSGGNKRVTDYFDFVQGLRALQSEQAARDSFLSPIADKGDEFRQLYFQSEASDARGDRTAALQQVSRLYQLVASNRAAFGRDYGPLLGNAAITAERYTANDLARNLYTLALEVDPEHSNNIQNFVDFIVKAPVPDLYPLAAEYLARLKTGKHAAHRPERTLALEARLKSLMGQEGQFDRETVERMVEEFEKDPTNREKYISVMQFLDQVGDFEAMRSISRSYYEAAISENDRYLAVRGFADMLAGSPDARNELEAMDMYRYLVDNRIGMQGPESQMSFASLLHNYATLLYKHDYDAEAGRMWFEAYQRMPANSSLRRVYPLYLLRAGKADLAALVSEGKPITEMALQSLDKPLPDRFLPGAGEPWWTTTVIT